MKHILILLLSFSFFCSCGSTSDEKDPTNKKNDLILTSIKLHADSLLQDSSIHAVSIGIYKAGDSYVEHFGELEFGKGNTPTDATFYEIGSVSKTMTGVLVAQAELEGKLSLDDDIREYLKGDYSKLEYEGKGITIRNLLTHRAGLPKFLPAEVNEIMTTIDEETPFKVSAIEGAYSKEQFFKDLQDFQLDRTPGSEYEYSNADTELMAYILEQVYDQSFDEILASILGKQANMHQTKVGLSAEEVKQLASGYSIGGRKAPEMITPLWGAGGAIKATMPDMINYMKFQLDEEDPLVKRSHEAIFEEGDVKGAFYWPINNDDEDGTYYGHHGGTFGTQNWFFVMPKHDLGIMVVTNQSDLETAGKLLNTVNSILDDIR